MIRLNLLDEGRLVGGQPAWRDAAVRTATALTMASLAALAPYGWWLSSARHSLVTRWAIVESEVARVATLAARAEALRKRHVELSAQLSAIASVLDTRKSTAELLAAIARSVNDDAWLTDIRRAGVDVEIDGRARSLLVVTTLTQALGEALPGTAASNVRSVTVDADALRFVIAVTLGKVGP